VDSSETEETVSIKESLEPGMQRWDLEQDFRSRLKRGTRGEGNTEEPNRGNRTGRQRRIFSVARKKKKVPHLKKADSKKNRAPLERLRKDRKINNQIPPRRWGDVEKTEAEEEGGEKGSQFSHAIAPSTLGTKGRKDREGGNRQPLEQTSDEPKGGPKTNRKREAREKKWGGLRNDRRREKTFPSALTKQQRDLYGKGDSKLNSSFLSTGGKKENSVGRIE